MTERGWYVAETKKKKAKKELPLDIKRFRAKRFLKNLQNSLDKEFKR